MIRKMGSVPSVPGFLLPVFLVFLVPGFPVPNHLRKPALGKDDRLLLAALTKGPEIK